MPRQADPEVRTRLVEEAARTIVAREPLSLRRLAADVGTSTMAVYTHFGGLDGLLREVRREGFRRLADRLAAVPPTKDAVADLVALGWAYCLHGLENPDLYRVMFTETTPDLEDAAIAAATFLPVVEALERAIAADRLSVADAWDPAVQMWALAHGALSLGLAGVLTVEDLVHHVEGGVRTCLVGFGGDPASIDRSVRAARRRMVPPDGLPTLARQGATLTTAVEAARP
jgi:AcrR family transcriptional regulator